MAEVFRDLSRVDAVYGRVTLRRLYGRPMLGAVLGAMPKPPTEPDPLTVQAVPRRPLAGPGRAAAVELANG